MPARAAAVLSGVLATAGAARLNAEAGAVRAAAPLKLIPVSVACKMCTQQVGSGTSRCASLPTF